MVNVKIKTKKEMADMNPVEKYEYIKEVTNGFNYDPTMEYEKHADVKNGSWILIIRTIPIIDSAKPILYGIYWGIPSIDKYGRQICKIRTTEDVTLLNHEFAVIDESKLESYKSEGWELSKVENTNASDHKGLTLELLEKGRDLCEDERDIVRALQLDGLTETQACEEYFFSRHTDDSNYHICFLPREDVRQELYSAFGERR